MKNKLAVIFIVILAAVLRFISLDRVPPGLIPEEASTAWNAYSLARTGRDEWNNFLPLVFTETGGFKLALNSYLMIPAVKIFGLNEFSARFPTALAGVLSVVLTYFLAYEIFRKKNIAASAALLVAVSPWYIAMSRYGVDVNWGIPLFISGLLFFLKSQKKPWFMPVSGLFFALTYYTYFNYVVFTFLFIVFLVILYRKIFADKKRLPILFLFFLIQIIFLLPYITQKNLTVRFSQATSVGAVGLVNRIDEHREACGNFLPGFLCQLIYNKPVEKVMEFGKNYINHYSTTTFFLYGSNLGLSGMPQNWGFLYLFEFPLILLGMWILIRKRMFPHVLLLWGFLYGVPSSLAGEAHIWRMMTILPLPQIIGAIGLVYLFSFIKDNLMRVGIIAVICFSILRFVTDYFTYLPFAQGNYSYYGFRDLYRYLETTEGSYDNIVIAPTGLGFNQLYIYFLFYTRFDPRKYQMGEDIERVVGEQNWVWVNRIGKWYFVSEPKKVKYPLSDKTLLVTDNIKPDDLLYDKTLTPVVLHTIYHINGDVAFKILNLRLRSVESIITTD